MPQAKVLTEKEIRKVLLYIASKRHATRNRCLFLLTHLTGMRVGEVAALRLSDVLDQDGQIRDEIRLTAQMTKGNRGRVVLIAEKAQDELRRYLQSRFKLKELKSLALTDTSHALFATQKNPHRGFSANTLCQTMHYIYKNAGISDGSSHSGRRGFITALAEKGISVRVLQELAGHRSMAVTQRYIEVNPAVMRRAVDLI